MRASAQAKGDLIGGYLLVEVNWKIGLHSSIGTRQRVPCGDKEAANWELPGGASSAKMREGLPMAGL